MSHLQQFLWENPEIEAKIVVLPNEESKKTMFYILQDTKTGKKSINYFTEFEMEKFGFNCEGEAIYWAKKTFLV